jgi:hypothetical protein
MVQLNRPLMILTLTALFLLNAASYIPSAGAASGQMLFGCAHTGAGTGNPGPSTLYNLDPSTGVATAVGTMGIVGCSGLGFQPSTETLFAVGGTINPSPPPGLIDNLFMVNPTTGVASVVGPSNSPACGPPITDISYRSSDGMLFGYSAGCMGTIKTSTGVFTDLGSCTTGGAFPSCDFPDGNGLAFSSSNVLFYAECCHQGANKDTLYTINQGTGVATVLATISTPPACSGHVDVTALAFDVGGTLYGAVKCTGPTTFYLVTINTSTAALIVLGPTVSGLDGLAWTKAPAIVPEYPLGLPLLAIFMIFAYGSIRRRTKTPKNI